LGGVTGNGRLGVARNYLSVYQKAFGVSRHSEGGVSDFISGTFLQAGIEAGSVGLFLFIMFFVMIIKRSFKEALAEKGKSLGCYIIFSLVFFSIYSVFTYTFSNVSLLFVFFLLAFFPAKTDRNKIMLSSKLLLLPLVIAGFLLAFAALNFYSEAASKMARAASLQNLKNKKRILLMYETSLFANPYNQYALEGYSGYLYKAGEYKKSCVYFSRLLKIRTEIKDLYLYALCLVKTGELNAALKLADKMLVLHGRGYEGYVIKGIISASSNDIQKAVYYFSRSIQNGASPVLAEKHLGKYFDAVYKNWLKGFLGK
jgi:tetratricopeptide (TPR) repeat protein